MPARGHEFYLRDEHDKIKFVSISGHVMFCLLYKHTNYDVFDDFSKISDHFPKISEDFPKIVPKARQTFPNIFRTFSEDGQRFPKKTEDFRGRTHNVSIIQHHI